MAEEQPELDYEDEEDAGAFGPALPPPSPDEVSTAPPRHHRHPYLYQYQRDHNTDRMHPPGLLQIPMSHLLRICSYER